MHTWDLALYYDGKTTEAETVLEGLGPHRRAQAALASFLAARGERARATALVDEVQASSDLDHHVEYSLGAAYAQLGDATAALQWLGRAAATFPCHSWFVRDRLLVPIRDDARFQKLMIDLERRVTEFRDKYGGWSGRARHQQTEQRLACSAITAAPPYPWERNCFRYVSHHLSSLSIRCTFSVTPMPCAETSWHPS